MIYVYIYQTLRISELRNSNVKIMKLINAMLYCNVILQSIRSCKIFLSFPSEEISRRGRVNKVSRKGKNSRARARSAASEYLRRVSFRRSADGNRAFSIGGFVAFIPARRHRLSSRRDASATLHCLSLRERAPLTSNGHRVATPADVAVPTALYLHFSLTSIGTFR